MDSEPFLGLWFQPRAQAPASRGSTGGRSPRVEALSRPWRKVAGQPWAKMISGKLLCDGASMGSGAETGQDAVARGRPLPGAGRCPELEVLSSFRLNHEEGVLAACVTRSLGSPLCSPRALPPTGTSSPLAVSVLSTGGLIQVRLRRSKRENGAFLGVRLTPLRWLFRPLWFTRVHKPQTPGRPSKNTTVLLMMKAIPGTGVGFAGVPVTAGGDSQRPALASAAGFPLTPRQCHPWHPVCAPDTLREQGPVRTDGRPGGGPSE